MPVAGPGAVVAAMVAGGVFLHRRGSCVRRASDPAPHFGRPLFLGRSASPREAPVPASPTDALIDWVRENGGFFSEDLAMTESSGRGISVISGANIEAGATLVRIPGSLDLRKSIEGQHGLLLDALDQPENWATQLAAFLALELDGDLLDATSFFAPYLRSLALDGALSMPVFQSPTSQELLQGSAEFVRIAKVRRQAHLVSELARLESEGGEGPLLNQTTFLRARCFVSTHVFEDAEGSSRLPPLAINFNHAPGDQVFARWQWDRRDDALHIWAERPIPAGSEVTISYGVRSNAQLLATYGFTVEPWSEPIFTFRIGLVADLLPAGIAPDGLDFRVRLTTLPRRRQNLTASGEPGGKAGVPPENDMEDIEVQLRPLGALLDQAAEAGAEPREVLEQLVDISMARYEADPLIAGFISQLRANRNLRPRRWMWWAPEQPLVSQSRAGASTAGTSATAELSTVPRKRRDDSSISSLGSRWQSDVARMKMSEYLCLVAYKEALGILVGDLADRFVLPQAVALAPVLKPLLRHSPPRE